MEKIYDYELIYRNNDLVSTTKFSAFIELQDLKDHLSTFLKSAGWSGKQVEFLQDRDERIEELEQQIDRLEELVRRYKSTIDELLEDTKDVTEKGSDIS